MDLKDKVQMLLDEADKKFLKVGVFEGDTYIYHEMREFDILDAQTQKKYHFPGTKIGLKIKEEEGKLDIDIHEGQGYVRALDKEYKHPCTIDLKDEKFPILSTIRVYEHCQNSKKDFIKFCECILYNAKTVLTETPLDNCNMYHPLDSFDEFNIENE